ncbi:hypothetical protein MKW98_014731 [Papaver atlanticum]|uniref:Uncharacterized protein n=1 Tax=Papaver atlanticum TaxID=357466 RepID=A0AAD4SG80_9MAGN|nr:hypothetical protein MKW98_014731 [Papaver atlanticum]
MEMIESIEDIKLQDLPEEFTSQGDDVALIPCDKVDSFITGECSIAECPTYWCLFGPESYGEGGEILPSRRYRINTRNRAASHIWICLPCPLDRDAVGPCAKTVPYICDEIQQQTMALIYLGIPEENILQNHMKVFNATAYVRKMGLIIRRSTHELDLDDQVSIRLWVEKNEETTFIYQDASDTDSFILGIQTEWQLQQMIRFGHHSLMAADLTFGIKKLKYPLCTLLVFDSRHHALSNVSKWTKDLVDRASSIDAAWKIDAFMIDDAAAEVLISLTTDVSGKHFAVLSFSLSGVSIRLRNIVKRCHNIEVRRDMFKCLGRIAYSIRGEMWLAIMRSLPRASQKACGATDGYHLKLKLILYDDSHLGSLQRVEWRIISHHLHGIELRKFQKMLLSLTTKIASFPRKEKGKPPSSIEECSLKLSSSSLKGKLNSLLGRYAVSWSGSGSQLIHFVLVVLR